MSDAGADRTGDDPTDLAGEYVLGVLDAAARADAEARLVRDPGFRAEVAAWERRLAPLIDEVAPVLPSDRVWGGIDAAINKASTVIPFQKPVRAWDRVGVWRVATGAAAALAACLAIALFMGWRAGDAQTGPSIASLKTQDGQVLFVAVVDRARGSVVVAPTAAAAPGGRYPELWVIPAGGTPRPVGMLASSGPIRLSAPVLAAIDPHARPVLAVSLEPAGGSPTGQPTGPVVARGPLTPA
jgi:anti-sigma-K factor RskA